MTAGRSVGWDDPRTARRYEEFCARHGRYRDANAALAAHAALRPGLRVLDVGAGTGRTADAILPHLGPGDTVVCVEPAAAMRALGRRRLRGAPVVWRAGLPRRTASFDRVLCGAAIWQMLPVARGVGRVARHVAPGGALCFDVPSAYLGEPDAPGGGGDPYLVSLVAALASLAPRARARRARAVPAREAVTADAIDRALREAGLTPERWSFRRRLTQIEFRDWMRIPVLTDRLLAGVPPARRDRLLDRAWRSAAPEAWRWEAWSGWTAFRPLRDDPERAPDGGSEARGGGTSANVRTEEAVVSANVTRRAATGAKAR